MVPVACRATCVEVVRPRRSGPCATEAREPSQVRKEAALSGHFWVPPGRLTRTAGGPPEHIPITNQRFVIGVNGAAFGRTPLLVRPAKHGSDEVEAGRKLAPSSTPQRTTLAATALGSVVP